MLQSELDKLWERVGNDSANSDDKYQREKLPDGEYECIIDDAVFKTSQSGNTGVSWQLHVTSVGGNRKEFKWSRLRQDNAEAFLEDAGGIKRDFDILGVNCQKFHQLDMALYKCKGKRVLIEVKTTDKGFRYAKLIKEIIDTTKQSPLQDIDNDDDVPF